MTQPKTDLAYLRNEKAKAEQKLRSCQHREKILERRMSELNRRERVHRLCTRAGMLESFLVCPGELTDDQVMELLKISFRQPEVVLALAKMVHDVHEKQNVPNPLCNRAHLYTDVYKRQADAGLLLCEDEGFAGESEDQLRADGGDETRDVRVLQRLLHACAG